MMEHLAASRLPSDPPYVEDAVFRARDVQKLWSESPLRTRLSKLAKLRRCLADQPLRWAGLAASPGHSLSAALVSEFLPLLEACRFLERNSSAVLSPRSPAAWGTPLWMGRIRSIVHREPHGVIGVVSPGNYPLYLGAVQVLQAIVAGNAVLWKPAPGCSAVATSFVDALVAADFPVDLVQVLGETNEDGRALCAAAIDKLFFTGSHAIGVQVLQRLAKRAVPSVMELSGCDAVFVRADADIERVVRALRFGLLFNESKTCIAPRRLYAHRSIRDALIKSITQIFGRDRHEFASPSDSVRLRKLFEEALSCGAHFLSGGLFPDGQRVLLPAIIEVSPEHASLFHGDFFLPLLSLVVVQDDEEALRLDSLCPYALGASVFSRNVDEALALSSRVRAGAVAINDLIAPTADPRVPFGGSGASGFGSTRGPEGLLEMTRPKVVQVRKGRSPSHLRDSMPDPELLEALTRFLHGDALTGKMRAAGSLIRRIARNLFARNAVEDSSERKSVQIGSPTQRTL